MICLCDPGKAGQSSLICIDDFHQQGIQAALHDLVMKKKTNI